MELAKREHLLAGGRNLDRLHSKSYVDDLAPAGDRRWHTVER